MRLHNPQNLTDALTRLCEGNQVTLCVAEFYDWDTGSSMDLIRRVGFVDSKGDFHYTQAREINGTMSGGMSRNMPARYVLRTLTLGEAIREIL